VCTERGYGRLEWWVLKWNTPSIGFYDSIGGQPMDEWLTYRLQGPALDALVKTTSLTSGRRLGDSADDESRLSPD